MTASDAAADAAHRRHRRRAGGLCRIFVAPARARAARTGGERGAGARAPPMKTSSPACPTTPRRSNCSTSRLAERAGDDVTTFALIELDGMADVNAQLGVLGGDELVVAVAARLQHALPADAVCGRIGSDEFAVMLTAGSDVDAERRPARRARRHRAPALDRYRGADQRACRLCAGAAPCRHPRRADAPRRARAARGGQERRRAPSSLSSTRSIPCRATSNSSGANCRARSAPTRWRCTISRSSPSQGARIVGVEALLRWTHADARRRFGPATFVPVAEQMGLMDTLGAFVLRRALAGGQALARPLRRGESVAAAGARPRHRRSGAHGARRERRPAGAADAGNHRRRADRQSGRDGQAHRGPACARRAHRARRFRLRLFEPRLSAALSARQAQDRPQLRHRARHIRQWRR